MTDSANTAAGGVTGGAAVSPIAAITLAAIIAILAFVVVKQQGQMEDLVRSLGVAYSKCVK